MARTTQADLVGALLQRHGRTLAEELGIDVARNTPSPLFRLLVAALLSSARISAELAADAARALQDHGYSTPQKMAGATWAQRTRVLNRSGYARYDEQTSRMFGDACDHLLETYGGDLRALRDAAGREPADERRLLKELKGIGDVGADIFLREVQVAWDEVAPFVDAKAQQGAERLGLPTSAARLRGHAERAGVPLARLAAALVRCDLAKDEDGVREAAAAR